MLNAVFAASEAGVRIFPWSEHHRLENEGVIIEALEGWGIGL